MKKMDKNALATVNFEMRWKSRQADHVEVYSAGGVNIWRDCLPEALVAGLEGKTSGVTLDIDFAPGTIVNGYDPKQTHDIKLCQFNQKFEPYKVIEPRTGRFYPKGLIRGIAGVFPQNLQPFRCVDIQNGRMRADFNHPLSKATVQLRSTIGRIGDRTLQQGGRCHDWMNIMAEGPGMQARWKNRPTEFFQDHPFERMNNESDLKFYEKPRLVQHIDDTAANVVKDLYGLLLKNGMRVLDLMSSWQSHIPGELRLKMLTGLGLNEQELRKNKYLDDWVVHDLNENPVLPFKSNSYDAVICTVSIEYIIHPETIFNEISRILRVGGVLIITFSNRWFSPKVINIWEELHDFERMGLVLEYFLGNGEFEKLETYSIRGLQRPYNDKYFPEKRYSDPIYAVWGRKA